MSCDHATPPSVSPVNLGETANAVKAGQKAQKSGKERPEELLSADQNPNHSDSASSTTHVTETSPNDKPNRFYTPGGPGSASALVFVAPALLAHILSFLWNPTLHFTAHQAKKCRPHHHHKQPRVTGYGSRSAGDMMQVLLVCHKWSEQMTRFTLAHEETLKLQLRQGRADLFDRLAKRDMHQVNRAAPLSPENEQKQLDPSEPLNIHKPTELTVTTLRFLSGTWAYRAELAGKAPISNF